MDTPFNFEEQHRNDDESDYLKGKNAFKNREFATDSVENPDKELAALFEAAVNSLEEEGDFTDENLTTKLRQQFLNMVLNQPIVQKDITDIDSRTKRQLEIYAQIITDKESVFHTDNEYDAPTDIEDTEGIEPPYEDIRELYDDMRTAFARSFREGLDPLDIIPSRIFLNQSGQIHSAEFDLLIDRDDMSRRFRQVFRESDMFQLDYDRYLKKRPFNRFRVSGIIPGAEVDDIEDTISLDHRI